MPVYSPFSPFATNAFRPGEYQRYEPFSGMPMASFLEAAMRVGGQQQTMLSYGMNPHVNLYNNLRYQAMTQRHDAAMMSAFRADAPQIIQAARGMYVAAGRGNEFTDQTAQDILNWHQSAQNIAPFISSPQMLSAYDTALGGRSQLPLAHYVHSAGRFQRDPMTGMSGLSANSAADMANAMHRRFFSDTSNFSASGGLKSAEFGEMYQELASSGRIPGLSKASDPRIDRWSRQDAANTVNETLERYARVLGTMKEIFAAEGQPNKPINQLLDAAEALTGGLQQMGSREAESRLRTVHNAARGLGLGMDAVVAGMRVSSAQVDAFGLNDVFSLPIAQQGFEFRSAANKLGLVSTPAWGLRSLDQLQMQSQHQQAGFVGSEAGNRIGMLQRMAQRFFGGENGGIDASKIQGDTPMARAFKALAGGDYNNEDLAGLLSGNQGSFINQVSNQLGISTGQVAMELQFNQQNQEAVFRNNLHMFGGAAQMGELRTLLFGEGTAFGVPTQMTLGEMLGNRPGVGGLSDALTAASSNALLGASTDQQRDPILRRNVMAKAMEDQLRAAAQGTGPEAAAAQQALQRMGASQFGVSGSLQNLAEQQFATAENFGIESGMLIDPATGKPMNLVNYLMTLNPQTQREMQGAHAGNAVDARLQSQALGLIDSSGVLGRMFSALQEAGQTGQGSFVDILKKSIGVDVNDKQAAKMASILGSLDEDLKALDEERQKLSTAGAPGSDRYDQLMKEIKDEQAQWSAFLEDPANAGVKEALIRGATQNEQTGEGGGPSSVVMNGGVNLYVNGELMLQNGTGRGTVGQGARGGGPVAQ